MPVQIISQRAAQDAAKAVTWCYICGRSLNSLDSSEAEANLSTDHVIPRGVLGDEPFSQRDSWRLTLRGHKGCEVSTLLAAHVDEIARDYNEATFLHPFWQNYPPEDRGRAPKGDQIPWIEVGEHVFGAKLARFLPQQFKVADPGLPTGPDVRFLLEQFQSSRSE